MVDVGGDVVLLRASCGPRVRFQEHVRVRDYNDSLDFHCLERWERLKGSAELRSPMLRRRRKCALLVFSSCDKFLPTLEASTEEDDDDDDDEVALRAFLDNSPPDQDLLQPLAAVSLIPTTM